MRPNEHGVWAKERGGIWVRLASHSGVGEACFDVSYFSQKTTRPSTRDADTGQW